MGLLGKKEGKSFGGDEFIVASQIANNPEMIDAIEGKYAIIYNVSMSDVKFNDLSKAINRMAERGWRCSNICTYTARNAMYALMERGS